MGPPAAQETCSPSSDAGPRADQERRGSAQRAHERPGSQPEDEERGASERAGDCGEGSRQKGLQPACAKAWVPPHLSTRGPTPNGNQRLTDIQSTTAHLSDWPWVAPVGQIQRPLHTLED